MSDFPHQVKHWRRQLHAWDNLPSSGERPVFTSGPANAWAPDQSASAGAEDGSRKRDAGAIQVSAVSATSINPVTAPILSRACRLGDSHTEKSSAL